MLLCLQLKTVQGECFLDTEHSWLQTDPRGAPTVESDTMVLEFGQTAANSELDVSRFRPFNHSRNEVNRVGDRLKRLVTDSSGSHGEAIRLFRIAHAWRESHSYPMKSVRTSAIQSLRRLGIEGTTGSRLKRLPSIREKLSREPEMKLSRMQDIGGCRVICETIHDAVLLKSDIEKRRDENVVGQKDYVARPKSDGYRCFHLIIKFENPRASAFDGRRIEVQVRSRLQHSWATAVEAVGLVRNENLKGGVGSEKWLRLFKLMSGQLALAEGCPPPADLPTSRECVSEIRDLNNQLKAIEFLENTRYVVREIEPRKKPIQRRPTFYGLEFDNVDRIVKLRPFYNVTEGIAAYNTSERRELSDSDQRTISVLVEANNVEELKRAFPNYFVDVELFGQMLSEIVGGRNISEFAQQRGARTRPRREHAISTSWLNPGKSRRWVK